MSNKFDIGDEVICKYNYAYIRLGTRVMVVGISPTGSLKLFGISGYYDPANFKLYKKRSFLIDHSKINHSKSEDTEVRASRSTLSVLMSLLPKDDSISASEMISIMHTFEGIEPDETRRAFQLALQKNLIKLDSDMKVVVNKYKLKQKKVMYKITAFDVLTSRRVDVDYYGSGDVLYACRDTANHTLITMINNLNDLYNHFSDFKVEKVEV